MKILTESVQLHGLEAIFEKYMGKSKNLVDAEIALDKVIKSIKKGKGTFSGYGHGGPYRIHNSKAMKELTESLKKEFNINRLDIRWVANHNANAYTIPKIVNTTDPRLDKKKQTSSVLVVLNMGLVTAVDLNAREMMAIILHELGHNFYRSYIHTLAMITSIFGSIHDGRPITGGIVGGLLQQVGLMAEIEKINIFIANILKGGLYPIAKLTEIIQKLGAALLSILPKTLAIPFLVMDSTRNAFQWMFRYNIEKESDSFAVDYGYGPDLMSAIDKISGVNLQKKDAVNFSREIPIVGALYDLDFVLYTMASGVLGSYPSVNKRVYESMRRLEKYEKDPDIPPELKKKIKRDREMAYEYMESRKDMNDQTNQAFTKKYVEILEKYKIARFDIRDILDNLDTTY